MNKFVKKIVSGLLCALTVASISVTSFAANATNAYTTSVANTKRSVDATNVCELLDGKTNDITGAAWVVTSSGAGGANRSISYSPLDETYQVFALSVTENTGLIEIYCNESSFKGLAADEKQTAKSEMLNAVNKLGLSQEARSEIQEDLEKKAWLQFTEAELLTLIFAETKADLSTAMKWFSPFSGTVGVVLGVGVIIIIVLLLVSTVFDLVYIGIPMIRNTLNGQAESKGSTTDSGSPKPFGVSYDAIKVVEESEGGADGKGGNGGNVYFNYLKRRVLTYIILAVCILYLISGQLSGIIGWLLNLVSGIA